jgi:glycosyltransferase involved in cell wall biosynthesis
LAEIAFVLPSFAGGGAERVALTLAGGLNALGFATSIIAFSDDGPLASSVPPGVPVHVLGRSRLRSAAPRLLRRLRKVRPDLVVSTLPHVNLLLGAMRSVLPGRTALLLRQSNMVARGGSAPGRALALAYAFSYRRADAVVALTEAMRAELAGLTGLSPAAIHVLPNPVDVARLRAAGPYSLPRRHGGVELVAIGRLVAQKNTGGLLDALARVRTGWRLTILGDGPERTALGERAARLGIADRVTFAGFSDRPAALVRAADALVMASRWEGMPNAALEALACGTPVIGPAGLPALEELAVMAPRDVRLYGSPEGLAHLVEGIRPADRNSERPSLLPAPFELDNALAAFAALARSTMARRRGTALPAGPRERSAG